MLSAKRRSGRQRAGIVVAYIPTVIRGASILNDGVSAKCIASAVGILCVNNEKFEVEGIAVDTLTVGDASREICDALSDGASFCVYTINLDHVVKLRASEMFRRAYSRARFVLADGFPIVLAGRLQGQKVSRAAGSDLIDPLCEEAGRRGIPVFLLGSTHDVLSKTAQELKSRYPSLLISGLYAPPAEFDVTGDGAREAIDMLRSAGGGICLVALGAPKQEIFADRCTRDVSGMAFICIGAGLDFIAGTQKRAPRVFQRSGLEWLWRLASNPGRLGRRYAECVKVMPSVLFGRTK
jgi:exopolysaccharide biosynthesis WecB/TagA/CpsF family protein